MATVEEWIGGHEKICGDRYRLLMSVIGVGGTIILSVAGWGLKTVHDDQHEQVEMLRGLASQISQTKPAPVNVQMTQQPAAPAQQPVPPLDQNAAP